MLFLYVGTPQQKRNANLEQITSIVKSCKKESHIKNNIKKIIVIKNAVPPGTTDNLNKILENLSSKLYFASAEFCEKEVH